VQRLGFLTDRMVPPANVVTPLGGGLELVRTPELPSFWFGNLLELADAPEPSALAGLVERWPALIGQPRPQRIVLQWETPTPSLTPELRAEAERLELEVEDNVVLRLDGPAQHSAPGGFVARPARSDADWAAALAVGTAEVPDHADFSASRQVAYRARAETGLGDWWIGELDGEVVSSAGIYWDEAGRIARYQAVDTLERARGRGCASALLGAMARDVQERLPALEAVVIVAEVGQQAERIYRRLGFAPVSWQSAVVGQPPD
jgi:ribosomal protein S18 acetylase RimI-like enzyme